MPAGTLFLVGSPKPDRPEKRDQTKRDKLVLQYWGFCGWVGNPPKEKQSTQKQRRTASDTDGLNDKRPGRDLGRPRKRWQRVDGGTGQTT